MKEGGFRDELTENRHRIRERLYLFFSSPIAAAGRLDTNSQAFSKDIKPLECRFKIGNCSLLTFNL